MKSKLIKREGTDMILIDTDGEIIYDDIGDYPGLFFAGEMLDIDGDTGGYNLQFAYASAMAALTKIYRS